MVNEFRAHPGIRQRAREIVWRIYRCDPSNQVEQALAIGDWVRRNIRYVREIPETFQTPVTTLATKFGDCDDFTTLTCSLLESVGIWSELVGLEWSEEGNDHPWWIRALGLAPDEFRHIFARAKMPSGEVVPLDGTLPTPIFDRVDPIELAAKNDMRVRVFAA